MKRGHIEKLCGPPWAKTNLFIVPDENHDDPWKKRNVFVLPSSMRNFNNAKKYDVVYYQDQESEKKEMRGTHTQATLVLDEYTYNNACYYPVTTEDTIDQTAHVFTPPGDYEGDYEDRHEYWTDNAYEGGQSSGSSMPSGLPPAYPWKKARVDKDEPRVELVEAKEEPRELVEPKEELYDTEDLQSTIPAIADFTPQPDLIPPKFHKAIDAFTELATIGVEMSYADIAQRIEVYHVKGYNIVRFALHELLFDGLQAYCCTHDGFAEAATDRRRFHGNDNLYGLLRSRGVVRDSHRALKDKPGWYHYSFEKCLETLHYARPQDLGGSLFRVMIEFHCQCWNSTQNKRAWCYTRSGCTNYAMKALWLFPEENCNNVVLY